MALHSAVLGNDLQIGEMVFTVPGSASANPPAASRKIKAGAVSSPPAGFALLMSPFPTFHRRDIAGSSKRFLRRGKLSRHLSGDAELTRLVQVARAFGIGTPGIGLAGGADVEA